jgi:hypothetical protein
MLSKCKSTIAHVRVQRAIKHHTREKEGIEEIRRGFIPIILFFLTGEEDDAGALSVSSPPGSPLAASRYIGSSASACMLVRTSPATARKRRPEIQIPGWPRNFWRRVRTAHSSSLRFAAPKLVSPAPRLPPMASLLPPVPHLRRHQPGLSIAGAAIRRHHLPPAPPSVGAIFRRRRHQPELRPGAWLG